MDQGFSVLCRLCAAAAMGRLGWTPDMFWGATPAELLMALGPVDESAGAMPLDRAALEQMEREARHG